MLDTQLEVTLIPYYSLVRMTGLEPTPREWKSHMLAIKHHIRENLVFSEVGRPRESLRN